MPKILLNQRLVSKFHPIKRVICKTLMNFVITIKLIEQVALKKGMGNINKSISKIVAKFILKKSSCTIFIDIMDIKIYNYFNDEGKDYLLQKG